MAEHIVSRRTYLWVWAALVALMALTALLSRIDLGGWSTPIALTIAVAKAVLVILFFMHVRYESHPMTLVVIVGGFFWLGILLALSMSDYLSRGLGGAVGH